MGAMFTIAVSAQKPITSKLNGDTLTNADTVYVTLTGELDGLAGIQVSITKISGTVAGNAILEGSIDGSAWVTVVADTLTFSNTALQSKVWSLSSNSYKTYRVRCITSGTQSCRPAVAWIRRF